MTDSENEALSVERVIQLIAGVLMWGVLMYMDWQDSEQLSNMDAYQIGLHAAKYAVAFILIKGVSMEQVNEFVRAWKGRNN